MSKKIRIGCALVAVVMCALAVHAQNTSPNPYRTIEGWAKLPDGRTWGATSAIYPANDGKNIWVAERCGTNLCVDSDVDPVLLFDPMGNVVKSFGAGMIVWPHGIYVDADDNVWIADAVGYAPVPDGVGHVILKFSPDGKPLMTLGKQGVAGDGTDVFNKPSDMLVAPNGDIFVADGHDEGGNNRIIKFVSDGTFIKQWGETGYEDGQFRDVTHTRLPWIRAGDSSSAIAPTAASRFSTRAENTSAPGRSSDARADFSSRTTSCTAPTPSRMRAATRVGSAASASEACATASSPRSSPIPSPTRTTRVRARRKASRWTQPGTSTVPRSALAHSRST